MSLANGYLCKYVLLTHQNEAELRLDVTQCGLGGQSKTSPPIKSMMFMDNKTSIWLGCGLDVVIVDAENLTELNRIRVYEGEPTNDWPIVDMCCHGDQVWCFRRRSWDVVEIDVGTLTRVCKFDSSLGTSVGEVPTVWYPSAGAQPRSRPNRNKQHSMVGLENDSSVQCLHRKCSIRYTMRPVVCAKSRRRYSQHHVCSLLYSNGALWVGRRSGDILIVNVMHNNASGYKYGQTIALLQNGYLSGYGNGAVKRMVRCRNRIVATRDIHGSGPGEMGAELVVWSADDTEHIHNAEKYWTVE